MKESAYFLLFACIFIILNSCRNSTDYNPLITEKSLDTLSSTVWKFVSFENESGEKFYVSDISMSPFILNFQSDSVITGRSGCNDYWCTYSISNDSIFFGPFMTTLVLCPLTGEYTKAFLSTKKFKATEDNLQFFTNDIYMQVMNFERYYYSTQVHSGEAFKLDLNNDGVYDFTFEYLFDFYNNDTTANTLYVRPIDETSGINWNARSKGKIIDSTLYYYDVIHLASLIRASAGWLVFWRGAFASDKGQNIALRIKLDEAYYYGWANISIDKESGKITLNDYAYQPIPNKEILSGIKP